MKKFVVYLTSYTGTLLPPKYIGSTSEDKILSGKYFGSISSEKWKDIFHSELSLNKHLFSVEIISIHETRKEAFTEELRLHILFNVVKSSEYFNEAFANATGFNNYGRKFSEAHRKKLSISHQGNTPSEKTLIKMSESHKGFKFSEESKEKIVKSNSKIKIFQFNENGILQNEFISIREAHRLTGKSISKISACCNNHINYYSGFIWKFKNEMPSSEILQQLKESKIPWNKGKKGIFSEETINNIAKALKNNTNAEGKRTQESCKNIGIPKIGNQYRHKHSENEK